MIIPVVMAGGQGSRLWPLSRLSNPKQFCAIADERTLFELTVDRVSKLALPENIIVVTSTRHSELVSRLSPEIRPEHVISEPCPRNTAACIGLAAALVANGLCGASEDDVMVVVPSDHAIQGDEIFVDTLRDAARIAESEDAVVTVGITPSRPETGYGYIKVRDEGDGPGLTGERFVEKPDAQTAQRYVDDGNYLWNGGIFVWKVGTILRLLREHLPELSAALQRIREADAVTQDQVIKREYEGLTPISIDYAVLEKLPRFRVVRGNFGWDDVGSWSSLERVLPADDQGNVSVGPAVLMESRDCVVHGAGRLVVTLGVDGLVVVDTPDTVFICPKDRAQDVRKVSDRLSELGYGSFVEAAPVAEEVADQTAKPQILFGTDGWRGVIGRDFTTDNVVSVAHGIADYVESNGAIASPIPIGYDTRFSSEDFAASIAKTLESRGLSVLLSDGAITSPGLSFAAKRIEGAGGVMITASHNPPQYNGVKFKGGYGGSALPEMTSEIQALTNRALPRGGRRSRSSGSLTLSDFWQPYLAAVRRHVDSDIIRRAKAKIVLDPMHGAGRGYVANLLADIGCDVSEIRGERNPWFGGVNPEPIEENLGALSQAVTAQGAMMGIALDGDGDRIGAVDEAGEFVNAHTIFALLLRHLVENRGLRGDVIKTVSTTEMIVKLSQRYGLPYRVTPIGFKYICQHMLNGGVLIGGEESGGIGFGFHIPERDAVLCALLLIELCATTGKALREQVHELYDMVGHHAYVRKDLKLDEAIKNALVKRLNAGERPDVAAISVDKTDGYKFKLDGGWLLVRPSGTEPVVRVYCEHSTQELAEECLGRGVSFALGAGL